MSNQEAIEVLLKTCHARGLTSVHLRKAVESVCVGSLQPGHIMYEHGKSRADEISRMGVRTQLSLLQEAWGLRRLVRHLGSIGGVLDAIVRSTSSSAEELAVDDGHITNLSDVVSPDELRPPRRGHLDIDQWSGLVARRVAPGS